MPEHGNNNRSQAGEKEGKEAVQLGRKTMQKIKEQGGPNYWSDLRRKKRNVTGQSQKNLSDEMHVCSHTKEQDVI